MRHLLCLTLALCCAWSSAAQAGAKKTRILLIGKERDHPYKTHEYMTTCQLLARCLEQTKGVEAVVSNGWPKDEKMLEGVKAIVLYTAVGGDVILAPGAREQCLKLLKNGVGLSAVHWSTGANQKNGENYQKILGGWFSREYAGSRLNTTTTKLMQADPKHPICNGWEEYDLRDEYYLDLKFEPGAKPVITVKLPDKNKQEKVYPVGWTYERPGHNGGRSFGFVCGHFFDCFAEKNFRKAVVNGILWTAHLDVPAEGAPVAITNKDLELPPPPPKK
jgi:type 1 glutamine amidotransferase